MTILLNTRCPFSCNTFCDTDCMLSLANVSADVVHREREETNNRGVACAVAVLASHVASKTHYGGNWIAKSVSFGGDVEREQTTES